MPKLSRLLGGLLVAVALGFAIAPSRPLRAQGIERPSQRVSGSTTVRDTINGYFPSTCVAIQASPGTGDMLAAAITIPHGCRELLLSAAFQNATIVYARINGTNLALLSGASFGADQLFGPIAIPVEEGDTVNFRLSVGNDGAATRKFKVEQVTGW